MFSDILHAATIELEHLNRETEAEFLRVGNQISGFIELVNLMSADLNALAELMSGQQGQRAAEALNGVLQQSVEMRTRSENGGHLLACMREEANHLKLELSRFSSTNATFHSLGLLTRIETARLGSTGADFGNLAEEVRLLARNVQNRVEGSLSIAGDLVPRIESALQEVATLQEGQAKNLPVIIAQVSDSLHSFREMQAEAREASAQLVAAYREIANAFNRLIVSMQFNDITRQQVEHVSDALQRLIHEKNDSDGTVLLECPGASRVLELQSSQLANASETFSRSAASVAKSLEEIAAHVEQMVEQGGTFSGLTGKNPALRQMELGCNAILASLRRGADADTATFQTSESVAIKINEMTTSIEEVRAIETQMRRIAMNTRISAEHLGPSGEALGALADSIKQRAFESRQSSDSLVKNLYSMKQALTRFSAHARRPDATDQINRQELLDEIRAAIAELHLCQERSASQVGSIAARADSLCKGIRTIGEDFKVGVRFSQVVNLTREKLDSIIEDFGRRGDGEDSQAAAQLLASFANQYTMREERDIFTGASRNSLSTSKKATDADLSTAAELMEDNIEFF
jgi:methyl-accepting chemotaxis protein